MFATYFHRNDAAKRPQIPSKRAHIGSSACSIIFCSLEYLSFGGTHTLRACKEFETELAELDIGFALNFCMNRSTFLGTVPILPKRAKVPNVELKVALREVEFALQRASPALLMALKMTLRLG